MRFVIAGAGAIGAYLGARLSRAGMDVTLFARGPQLAALQETGVRVESAAESFTAKPAASGNLEEIGPADVVFLAVKAHSLPQLAPRLPVLFHADTVVVSMQNGIPWWYRPLASTDPGGVIAASIEPRRVVGSIVYFATELAGPGNVRHDEGDRISMGEPDRTRSERVREIAQALIAAGFRCPVTTRFEEEMWVKLLGNVSFNPISALTGATLAGIARNPETRALVRGMMLEAREVAAKLGVEIPISIEQRIAGAEKVGEHKTSMLQDLELGRPLELEAIDGALLELGEGLGVAMPQTRAVYACVKLLAAR